MCFRLLLDIVSSSMEGGDSYSAVNNDLKCLVEIDHFQMHLLHRISAKILLPIAKMAEACPNITPLATQLIIPCVTGK